jgi:pyruvate/2-oxoglutarate/acetoin dehydrogenase E1 component
MTLRYFDELKRSMEFLSRKDDTVFLGQAVACPGTGMSNTLKDIEPSKLLELPVCEEMQMGLSNGLALNGSVPISIFPRWNFLLCAASQLVNHLDKLQEYSSNDFSPKVIIRTAVGSERPLYPQQQHVGNFSEAFRKMLVNVDVVELIEPKDIYPAYQHAYERTDNISTILVEFGDFYNEK